MAAGNYALDANPSNSGIDINTNGSDWLWAVFATFLLTDLLFVGWSFSRRRGTRAFHILAIAILTVGTIVYYSMASDLGATPVTAEFYGVRHQDYAGEPATRAIWWCRYVMWFLTGPLLVLEVALASALPVSDIFGAMFMIDVSVICGLVGALTPSSYKWGYYGFGCASLIYVVSVLLGPGRISAGYVGNDVRSLHTRGAAYLAFIWLIYPISWGLSEGGNVITSDGEMIFYGILDLFTMPFFLALHLFQLRTLDYSRFGMTGVGVGGVGRQYQPGEKGVPLGGGAPAPMAEAGAV
ncbi:family A G protein-coupled receptor-like protein [Calocera cornea HHB12733]|uniref:Family A G protein-coupled receptor-like protein n=1 Tax=Calocera cornea HHB12733 TaxID=1353952 RepID=A0A165FD34_9BASI|nr:family A G protein-coupled receptor-like protein [Calocera cornea HHB12733]